MVLPLEKKTSLMHSRAKEKCLLDYPQFRPFSIAPRLLGKVLENERRGKQECEQERETRQGSRAQWGKNWSQQMVNSRSRDVGKAWGCLLRVLGSRRSLSFLLPLF